MDELIQENIDKAKKKYEKMGMDTSSLEKAAKTRTANLDYKKDDNKNTTSSTNRANDSGKKSSVKELAGKTSTKDVNKKGNGKYKEGSIAAYANMLNRENYDK